jgi:coenzyme F420-reducing hydrogenase delta subunit
MKFVGIDLRRLQFSWVSASEAIKWVDLINNMTEEVKALGPFVDYKGL